LLLRYRALILEIVIALGSLKLGSLELGSLELGGLELGGRVYRNRRAAEDHRRNRISPLWDDHRVNLIYLPPHSKASFYACTCILSAVFRNIATRTLFPAVQDITGQSVTCPNAALCSRAMIAQVRPSYRTPDFIHTIDNIYGYSQNIGWQAPHGMMCMLETGLRRNLKALFTLPVLEVKMLHTHYCELTRSTNYRMSFGPSQQLPTSCVSDIRAYGSVYRSVRLVTTFLASHTRSALSLA
jgi:hypothetical protein